MFKNLLQKIKEVLYKLNIIKGVENLADRKDLDLNEEFYEKIDAWKALYKGYYEEIHKLRYFTIGKGEQYRTMATLNMPKAVAQEMASLVFNEKCEISIGDEKTSDFIDNVLKSNKFYKKFQDHLEYSFALGGMVAKPYVKDDKLLISYVTADCFIPLAWQDDTVWEGVFPSEYKRGDKVYTHLEWHVWETSQEGKRVYVIRNELYEAKKDSDDLGVKVPLETLFPGLDEEVLIKGLEKPIFSYIKPNLANNIDTQSPLGIPLYANSIDTLKAIDTAFDSFIREFRLGKKRIMVPAHMIKVVTDPKSGQQHRYFDANDETYEAVKYGNEQNEELKDISVELRVEEHIAGINALLNLYAMQTGFSVGTFSFDGESMKTATEVVSEQSKTFKSKKSHEIIIEAGIQDLIESIIKVAQLYDMFGDLPEDLEVTVTFDDSIVEDDTAEIGKQVQLVTNRLTSRKKAIMAIHGLTEEDADDLLAEINEENATATAESIDFFGNRGGGTNGNS